jgi:hypothetical protein
VPRSIRPICRWSWPRLFRPRAHSLQ